MMARELRDSSAAAGRETLQEGETGGAGNGALPEFLPEVGGVLAESDLREPGGGPESADAQLQVLVSQSMGISQDVRRNEGGLLGAIGPIDPVNFENLPMPVELPTVVRGNQGVPGVRRVEVGRIEPVNGGVEQGRPVMDGPTLVPPVGIPQVYGPQTTQPIPAGNLATPGNGVGRSAIQGEVHGHVHKLEQPQPTPVRTVEGSWVGGNVNPFWSPEVRAMAGKTGGGRGSQERNGRLGTDGRDDPQYRLNPLELFRARTGEVPVETNEPLMDPVELFKLQCLREAEQKFAQGIAKMTEKVETGVGGIEMAEGNSGSFHSAIQGGGKTPTVERPPGLEN